MASADHDGVERWDHGHGRGVLVIDRFRVLAHSLSMVIALIPILGGSNRGCPDHNPDLGILSGQFLGCSAGADAS
jgi:hypothetical protein